MSSFKNLVCCGKSSLKDLFYVCTLLLTLFFLMGVFAIIATFSLATAYIEANVTSRLAKIVRQEITWSRNAR